MVVFGLFVFVVIVVVEGGGKVVDKKINQIFYRELIFYNFL